MGTATFWFALGVVVAVMFFLGFITTRRKYTEPDPPLCGCEDEAQRARVMVETVKELSERVKVHQARVREAVADAAHWRCELDRANGTVADRDQAIRRLLQENVNLRCAARDAVKLLEKANAEPVPPIAVPVLTGDEERAG